MASELVPGNPEHERFDAVARSVVTGAVALTVAVLTAAALGWTGSPAGWLLVLAALLAALIPFARWRLASADRLPVGHLDEPWREVVTAAAVAVERIELAAADAPPGAVADHLHRLHEKACHQVEALHDTATMVASLTPPARQALLGDARTTTRRLVALADAAERLREAQRQHLGADPLAGLIEATDQLSASLRWDQIRPSP